MRRIAMLLALATVSSVAWAAQEAVGLSKESAGLLAQAAKSEQLGPHLRGFAALRQQAFAGDFAAALAAARKARQAAADQPVTEEELRARQMVVALLSGYEGELTALNGDLNGGRDVLLGVERLDVPADVKAMAREAQAFCDLGALNLDQALSNERRAADWARSFVPPVIEAAKQIYTGDANAAFAQLKALAGSGSAGGRAALYAASAALATGRLAEAGRLLDQAQPVVGYLPDWFLTAGLLTAANGDLAKANAYFTQGARRELGRVQRCRFLAQVTALAAGANARVQLGALAAGVPANYQKLAMELDAAPSAAAAKKALTTPGLWWNIGAYRPGSLAGADAGKVDNKTGLPAGDGLPEPTTPPPGPKKPTTPETARAAEGGGGGAAPATEPTTATGPKGGSAAGGQGGEIPEELRGVEVTTYSTQAVAAFNSGVAHLQAGRREQAWAALLTSVKLWPGLAEGWLALGGMLQQRGDARSLHDAVNAYGHAASLRPYWCEPYFGLGASWEALGQPVLATAYFQRSLSNGLSGDLATYARARLR